MSSICVCAAIHCPETGILLTENLQSGDELLYSTAAHPSNQTWGTSLFADGPVMT
jgi:hypothetical protein